MNVFRSTLALLVLTGAAETLATGAELDDPIPLVRWSGVARRHAFERANEGLNRGLVIDRRIDPSAEVDLALTNTSSRGVFEALAKQSGGVARFVGDTTYIGPTKSAPLRTMIRLRTDEALEGPASLRELARRRRDVDWMDFATPREVVTSLGKTFGVEIQGVEQLPHDLWAAAALPDATFAEAMSLVLVQFDRTFVWLPDGVVRIEPIPEAVGVERLHSTNGGTSAEVVATWRKRFPAARIEVAGRRVRVFALLETHEAIEAGASGEPRAEPVGEPSPLDRQRFTLRIEDVPAAALIKRLEQTGLVFTSDAAALQKAGIDLNAKISLDVEDATIEELLKAMCDPLKLDFERRGTSVRLTPRSP